MINTKLQNIIDTKSAIGNAIVNKGGTITGATPFYNYAAQIDSISTGGGAYSTFVAQDQDNAKYTVYNGYDSVTNPTPNLSNNFSFNQWLLNNSATGDVILSNVVVASGGNYNGPNIIRDDTDIAFVSNSLSYGDTITTLSINNGFIYAGGLNIDIISKFHESNLTRVGNSVTYPGNILTSAINDGFIYVGGQSGDDVEKFYESNLVRLSGSTSYNEAVHTIAINNGFVYAGGVPLVGVNRGIAKYHEGNLVRVGNAGNYGGTIQSIAINDGFIYVGGTASNVVRKYNESDLELVGNTATYGAPIASIAIDNGIIYVGGNFVSGTNRGVTKFYESNLALVGANLNDSSTANYGGTINSVAINNGFIYAGGGTAQVVRKYNATTLALVNSTNTYGGDIRSIALNNGFIYAGGASNRTIKKFNEYLDSPEQLPYYNITSIKE